MSAGPTVLALARSTSGFYFGEILAGLNREVAAAGGRLVVVQSLDAGDVPDVVVRMPTFDLPVAWDEVDGVVVVSLAANAPYLRRAQAAGKPVVLASHSIEGIDVPVVLPDNRGGTFSAVEHLLAHGHTRIGFVGNLAQHDMRERHAAWAEAMELYDLPVAGLFVEVPDSIESGGHVAADLVAALDERPTAVMVATDRNALGLLEGLQQHGLRVPEDVAVIGFDAIEAGAFSTPTLSSVSQRFDEVGALAGRLLLAELSGVEVARTPHVPADVVIAARGSCGCTSATDGSGGGADLADGADVGAARWRLQAATYLRRSQTQERLLTEQFRVAAGLLDVAQDDPASLGWLRGTHVRAGALAVWDGPRGDGRLRITGVHDSDGRAPALVDCLDQVVTVEAFPPQALVDLPRPFRHEACFVVPVRSHDSDWGLLAVVGDIDTTSSRDTYHHWAQLLCGAFGGEALERAVRTSEARYAHAARAAQDGLWEWEVGSPEVYMSERCRALIGLEDVPVPTTAAWFDAVHEDDRATLRATMHRALEGRDVPVEVEYRVSLPDGGTRWVLCRALGVGPAEGPVGRLIGSLSDVHPRKELEDRLRRAALYDAVTGLPNRRLFLDRLSHAVAAVDDGCRFAVLFLDLDAFKLVNDSLGHLAGDELLRVVGERLSAAVRGRDTAARFGGDEFAVLLHDLEPEEVLAVAAWVQEAVSAPVHLGDDEVSVSASVGIATSETGYRAAEDVLRDADIAMYHTKDSRRGSTTVFDRRMHERAAERLRARSELRRALAEEQLVVHYQPVVPLAGGPLTHFEALVRWQHPERGLLLPGQFLPALEDDTTGVCLGGWVLDTVCAQLARWRSAGVGGGRDVSVAVNVSHRDFWDADLPGHLAAALARHDVPGRDLVLEITESVVMADPEEARSTMAALRATGVRLHMDDFGTGHSSLNALRTFPMDALKIDGSFVRELGVVEQTTQLVRIIVDMGAALSLDVVAEHVETPAQAAALRALGCTYAQGWLYGRAVPADEAALLVGQDLDLVRV